MLLTGLNYVIDPTISVPIIKNIIYFLLFINVFISDFIISGMDDIINPKNNELVSYIFFSNMFVISNTD